MLSTCNIAFIICSICQISSCGKQVSDLGCGPQSASTHNWKLNEPFSDLIQKNKQTKNPRKAVLDDCALQFYSWWLFEVSQPASFSRFRKEKDSGFLSTCLLLAQSWNLVWIIYRCNGQAQISPQVMCRIMME